MDGSRSACYQTSPGELIVLKKIHSMDTIQFTIEIYPELLETGEKVYVAQVRDIDICSQGATIEEANSYVIFCPLGNASPCVLMS